MKTLYKNITQGIKAILVAEIEEIRRTCNGSVVLPTSHEKWNIFPTFEGLINENEFSECYDEACKSIYNDYQLQ